MLNEGPHDGAGGKLVIINLQQTPKDKKASLVIRARADAVMSQISKLLSIPIPTYIRQDAVILSCKQDAPVTKPNGLRTARLTLSVSSIHGPKCPLPMVETVDISFPVFFPACALDKSVMLVPLMSS